MENEVCFNQDSLIRIDNNVIADLKKRAKQNASGKYRLCMQHSPQDQLHEMFIVRSKEDYGRPDKHYHTTESHTIIDGEMLVILFEDNGEIREMFKLSKDNYHTYRIDTNIYHMQIPITEQVVYYEIKLGPFTEETNVYPEWAPDSCDKHAVAVYMQELGERIKLFAKENSL